MEEAQMSSATEASPMERAVDKLRLPRGHIVRREAEVTLIADPEASVPILIARLQSSTVMAPAIIAVLSRTPRPETVSPLAAFLGDPLPTRSLAAARALAKHPGPEAATALVAAVGSTEPTRQRAGLLGLGERGDPTLCDKLSAALVSDDEVTRFYAVRAGLAMRCFDPAARVLLTQDPNPEIRGLVAGEPILRPDRPRPD
jgi:HEAT repeat protein